MKNTSQVSSNTYDREYFLKHRGGSTEFERSKGKELYVQHKFAIELANLTSADRVLDLGCGCGEIALNAAILAKSVLAIDYSQDAIDLALDAKKIFNSKIQRKVTFIKADFGEIKLPSDYFDVTFFLDVIEHLTQTQIEAVLSSIYKALRPGGKLIVHTWPNRWHRQITYPFSYCIGKIFGQQRPKNPRTTHEELMHLSEQSPYELKCNLRKAGFRTKVFLHFNKHNSNSLYNQLYNFLHSMAPLSWVYCDHIWSIGIK